MKWKSYQSINLLLLAPFFFIIYLIGFHVPRVDSAWLIASFSFGFALLAYWMKNDFFEDERMIWLGAMIPRVILLFAVPMLSDDYFRFIWDGQLQVLGINPFTAVPADLLETLKSKEVYDGLNSKNYFSIYPPVMQFSFWLTSLISGENIGLNIFLLKVIVLIGDWGVIFFGIKILKKLGLKVKSVLIYALNPMVMVETVGNLHFEGVMMFFTLWAIFLLMRMGKEKLNVVLVFSAFIFSLGVCTKLISLLFLPALIRKLGFGKSMLYYLMIGLFTGSLFLIFINQAVIDNFTSSIDLYFRNFEFNASIYFLANWIYSQFVGWEEIKFVGPFLAAINLILIIIISLSKKISKWDKYFAIVLVVLTIHLLFSTTVHPWYVINLLVASMFTRYRFALVWSFAILFSYFFYQNNELPIWIVGLEYTLVIGFFLWELFNSEFQNKKEVTSKTNTAS